MPVASLQVLLEDVKSPACHQTPRRGIGRREVVIVLLLGGMILLVLLPYLARERNRARRAQCEMHQIRVAQALLHYEMDHGHFPGYKNVQAIDKEGRGVATGWALPVLPYLTAIPPTADYARETSRYREGLVSEESAAEPKPYADTYRQYGTKGPSDDRGKTSRLYIAELVCPSNRPEDAEKQPTWCSYVVNSGMPDAESTDELPPDWPANGVFMDRFSESGRAADPATLEFIKMHDGANATLLLSENVDSGDWTDSREALVGFVWVAEFVDGRPNRGKKLLGINRLVGKGDGSIRFARPSCYHSGGVNVAFCSGRTQFLDADIDYLVFARLMMCDNTNVKQPGSDELIEPPYRVIPLEPRE